MQVNVSSNVGAFGGIQCVVHHSFSGRYISKNFTVMEKKTI